MELSHSREVTSCAVTHERTRMLCKVSGLVVRVRGYKLRGPGFGSRRYQIFSLEVGLKRGPLSLVSIIEELLERKVAASV
jgi:hypothetical protein